jgi:hypothetical protein
MSHGRSPALLQRYVQPDQHYNLPLLVEDLDTFAADAASRHVGPTQNKLVGCAAVFHVTRCASMLSNELAI